MQELYDLTATEALKDAIDRVQGNNPELSRGFCKKLVLNALIYNCVIDEIAGQADFLLGKEAEYDS